MNRESIFDYRDPDTGREVRAQRPPFVGSVATQDRLGIDVGMCPTCKRGGVPRRYYSDRVSYFPHSNDSAFCRGGVTRR